MYRRPLYLTLFVLLGCLTWYVYSANVQPQTPPPLYQETEFLQALEASPFQDEIELSQQLQLFDDIRHIFKQTYYYKDHGASSVVFQSEDAKYILKLFNMRDARTEKEVSKRLSGYQLAYDINRTPTGILFWHQYKTDHLNTTVNLIDTIGINRKTQVGFRRTLDLDNYIFVIQLKAEKMDQLLNKALRKGKVEQARQYLKELFQLYDEELRRGIMDIDGKFFFNTGFHEGKPMRFDVSHLREIEYVLNDADVEDYRFRILRHVIRWIQRRDYEDHTEIIQDVVLWLTKYPKSKD